MIKMIHRSGQSIQVKGMSWSFIDRNYSIPFLEKTYPELIVKPGVFPVLDFLEFRMKSLLGFVHDIRDDLEYGEHARVIMDEKILAISSTEYDGLMRGEGHSKFTVMHEIGHILLNHGDQAIKLRNSGKLIFHRRNEIPRYADPEAQANVFAGSVLMPTDHVKKMIIKGTTPLEIANMFKISVRSAEIRFKDIKKF